MALLAEDLRSPCTEEIAVFSAFARTVAEGEQAFVVLDTAPTGHTILLLDAATGHTILLLDAAEAYHRDVTRTMSDVPGAVRQLLPRLRQPKLRGRWIPRSGPGRARLARGSVHRGSA
jgi:arsenite-transporting ATPase